VKWNVVLSKQAVKDAQKLARAGLKPQALKLLEILQDIGSAEPHSFRPFRFEWLFDIRRGAISGRAGGGAGVEQAGGRFFFLAIKIMRFRCYVYRCQLRNNACRSLRNFPSDSSACSIRFKSSAFTISELYSKPPRGGVMPDSRIAFNSNCL